MKGSNIRSIAAIGSRTFVCLVLGLVAAGCASTPGSGPRTTSASRAPLSCSERIMINLRSATAIRSDFELTDLGRRAGVDLDVLQQLGRTSRVVMIRAMGPESLCDSGIEEIERDPRVQSVQRYF